MRMHTLATTCLLTTAMIVCVGLTLRAQWRDVVTKGVPVTPAGYAELRGTSPEIGGWRTGPLGTLGCRETAVH
jgi:hypothetical protein